MRLSFFIVCYCMVCIFLFAVDNDKADIQKKFYASYAERDKWEYGFTLLGFLAKNNIPENTYYILSPEDKELVADVKTDSEIFIVRDSNGKLLQAFLPLNTDTQVRIFFDFKDNQYKINIVPIISIDTKQKVVARIQSGGSPSSALYSATKDPKLNQEFIMAYGSRHIVQKGDRIAVIYYRKYRLGKPIGFPTIESIAIESKGRFNYLFGFQNRYRDEDGKDTTPFLLTTPVKYNRISSRFSSGRRHPILGYMRPHYGVDLSAPNGTKVYAAGDGRILFAGLKGGYGKVVEIQHDGGIKTLYAHMSTIGKLSKPGTFVRRGAYIGNVGSTGLSTGPHLHFGVYKNNVPINPLGQIRAARSELRGSTKKAFIEFTSSAKREIKDLVENTQIPNDTNSVIIRTVIGTNDSQDLQDESEDDVGIETSNSSPVK